MVMSYDSNGRPLKKMRDGEPCEDGAKCLGHVTHPCETCGRVAGKVSTLDYRIALLNYEWEGGSPLIDGSDIHQMLMHSEEREQITIYKRLLGDRGIQLLDHEIACIWIAHSVDWDAQWLCGGSPEADIKFFEEFVYLWRYVQEKHPEVERLD